MSDTTKIQWADATFNPWIGCTKVSPGCNNCYAENTTRARVLRSQGHETWGKGAKRSRTSAATWRKPLQWNRVPIVCPKGNTAIKGAPGGHGPYVSDRYDLHNECCECGSLLHRMRIFPSLCDWLDDEVPIEWLADFLKLIHDTPHLTWLLLTKRPENFKSRLHAVNLAQPETGFDEVLVNFVSRWIDGHAPSNVWIGTSVENQAMADKRIPELLKTPSAVRFLSVEPMLGEIDLKLDDRWCAKTEISHDCDTKADLIHWVIFGGESGKGARPCNVDWILDGVKQCQAAGVAAFVKQLGNRCYQSNPSLDKSILFPIEDGHPHYEYWPWLDHPKGGDMSEWPEDLRVREMPK